MRNYCTVAKKISHDNAIKSYLLMLNIKQHHGGVHEAARSAPLFVCHE